MIVFAVMVHTETTEYGGWTISEYDKFFTTKEKATLRMDKLIKQGSKDTSYSIEEVEVGE